MDFLWISFIYVHLILIIFILFLFSALLIGWFPNIYISVHIFFCSIVLNMNKVQNLKCSLKFCFKNCFSFIKIIYTFSLELYVFLFLIFFRMLIIYIYILFYIIYSISWHFYGFNSAICYEYFLLFKEIFSFYILWY